MVSKVVVMVVVMVLVLILVVTGLDDVGGRRDAHE